MIPALHRLFWPVHFRVFAEDLNGQINRAPMSPQPQCGHSQCESTVEHGGRQEDSAVAADTVDDCLVVAILLFQAGTGSNPSKRHDRKIGWRAYFESMRFDFLAKVTRQKQFLLERGAERFNAQQ